MKLKPCFMAVLCLGISLLSFNTFAKPVGITQQIVEFTVQHGNKLVTVKRNQNQHAVIEPHFAKTSRPCPPFCAQPIKAAPGVRLIGEVELVQFMMSKLADGTGALVDARTPDWHAKGTIPGSINIPYTDVNQKLGADDISIEDAMERLSVVNTDNGWDFSGAKILAIWCNGPWCGQSPTAIRGLIALGYPPSKILYYRGGMQMWKVFGLNVVAPAEE
ncbi:MAG: rhodanese-like domain-containing protein [Magnetococcales bacterium]|nr:rhodanese-like domain-containing protein [Magnetococcales bacterium]